MPTLRKRSDVAWIAAAFTIGIGGAAFATATSGADNAQPARPATTPALPISAITDPALTSTAPSDRAAAAGLLGATGVAGDATAPQVWRVGGRSVLGYTADDGRFCFEFRGLAGGCLGAGALSDREPLDATLDHGPATFRVYGLALDGVTGVAVRIDGDEHRADLAHNGFAFSDGTLGRPLRRRWSSSRRWATARPARQAFPISSLDPP